MDRIGRTNGRCDELVARGFLNAHEKSQEPKVRGNTAHFQRLTGMHKAMQPVCLRWSMVTHATVALITNNNRLEFGLQELENLRLLITQLLLRTVVRNRQPIRF